MRRGITIVVQIDGDLSSHQYRVPRWAFEAGKWGAVAIALLVVLFFAFAGPLTEAAARVPGLERETARLRRDNGRVQELAAALNRAEVNYQELRQMLGVRSPTAPPESRAGAPAESVRAAPVRARPPAAPSRGALQPAPTALAPSSPAKEPSTPSSAPATPASGPPAPARGSSAPTLWPLAVAGFVTRGQVGPGDPAESHPGIDIAVPVGSAVRAAGAGVVETAGTDPDYGLFVLLRHPDGYETMYGHASRLLVQQGDSVQAGQVIALSGSSGRSTAPHLHFEVRREGKALDPLTVVKQEN